MLVLPLILLVAATSAPHAQADTNGVERLRSVLVEPLYPGERAPETRSLRNILLAHAGVPGLVPASTRTVGEAVAVAEQLIDELRAGADFESVAVRNSMHKNARVGAVLGTFAPGMLRPEFDRFLFSAEIGAISAPIATSTGVHVFQRIETHAACLQIQVDGKGPESRARCQDLLLRARAGEDFSALAREHSDDAITARRGGQLAIFERGPSDRLLKAAAFRVPVGGIVGPLESPLGWHLVKRVPLADVDPALIDGMWVRARAILIAFDQAPERMPYNLRDSAAARALAHELHARIAAGADMAALAREHDDDFTGRERAGDLGWIHRRTPVMSSVLDRLYGSAVGELLDPIAITGGWLLLRREG